MDIKKLKNDILTQHKNTYRNRFCQGCSFLYHTNKLRKNLSKYHSYEIETTFPLFNKSNKPESFGIFSRETIVVDNTNEPQTANLSKYMNRYYGRH